MALRINTNVAALNSHRQLVGTENAMNKSMQKLSSGYRINNAGDDASGLVQANTLRSETRVLSVQAQNTIQQRASLAIDEGDANTIENILERMSELAAKDTSSGGATETLAEFDALSAQIDSIASAGGANVTGLTASSLSVSAGTLASSATIATAINTVGGVLGDIGAAMNALDFEYSNTLTKIENKSAQESAIRDTDMAREMVNFTKNQIMLQAGTAMLAQANMSSQSVLSLLG